MRQIVLAITGASGALYARRLLQCLDAADVHTHLVISRHGRQLLHDELDVERFEPEAIAESPVRHVTLHPYNDLAAPLSSGSFRTDGMIVCPCSSNTLAEVAAGTADNLISRASLVTLKEARRLVLVLREMPLGQIEIANMLRVSQAGGVICPANPGFYLRPTTIEELIDFVVGRVLDLFDVPHDLPIRWDGTPPKRSHPDGA